MTNQAVFDTAYRQSAIESGCRPEHFTARRNVITRPVIHPDARKYLAPPLVCDLTSYGSNIVACVRDDLSESVGQYIEECL